MGDQFSNIDSTNVFARCCVFCFFFFLTEAYRKNRLCMQAVNVRGITCAKCVVLV